MEAIVTAGWDCVPADPELRRGYAAQQAERLRSLEREISALTTKMNVSVSLVGLKAQAERLLKLIDEARRCEREIEACYE